MFGKKKKTNAIRVMHYEGIAQFATDYPCTIELKDDVLEIIRIKPETTVTLPKDRINNIMVLEEANFMSKYYDSYWTPLMKDLSLSKYTPHCTRHTCVSLLTEAGVDERIIQKIVGHKGQNVTQVVYTHLELPIKLEAINKI